jgi:hypothetical protein
VQDTAERTGGDTGPSASREAGVLPCEKDHREAAAGHVAEHGQEGIRHALGADELPSSASKMEAGNTTVLGAISTKSEAESKCAVVSALRDVLARMVLPFPNIVFSYQHELIETFFMLGSNEQPKFAKILTVPSSVVSDRILNALHNFNPLYY